MSKSLQKCSRSFCGSHTALPSHEKKKNRGACHLYTCLEISQVSLRGAKSWFNVPQPEWNHIFYSESEVQQRGRLFSFVPLHASCKGGYRVWSRLHKKDDHHFSLHIQRHHLDHNVSEACQHTPWYPFVGVDLISS